MNGFVSRVSVSSGHSLTRRLGFLRDAIGAVIRHARDRRAARQVERDLRCSEQKLTDEMERRMTERFTRNRSFRL
jgi:hypothetical protein